MKKQINEIKKMQHLAGLINESQLNEESVTLQQTGRELGSYQPEDGDISKGLKDDCTLLGILRNTEGKADSLVFEGDSYVCILTVDSGYGTPTISVHDKSVLEEIKSRIQK